MINWLLNVLFVFSIWEFNNFGGLKPIVDFHSLQRGIQFCLVSPVETNQRQLKILTNSLLWALSSEFTREVIAFEVTQSVISMFQQARIVYIPVINSGQRAILGKLGECYLILLRNHKPQYCWTNQIQENTRVRISTYLVRNSCWKC